MAGSRPRVGITMGDAAGIGPEITVKCLRASDVYEMCDPVVLGDARVIRQAIEMTGAALKVRSIRRPEEAAPRHGVVDVIDYENVDPATCQMGVVKASNGQAAVLYTKEAGRMCLDGRLEAMVSAPLNKESMRAAGYHYEGQTEILAELCGVKRHGMALILGRLRIMLLTNHMSLREAVDRVKRERVEMMIDLAWDLLDFIGVADPVIAVSGLNPHAGEGGLFGHEEVAEIAPAVASRQRKGINVVGPLPPDTVFHRANQGEFSLVVAMYHDQGMMAAKLLGFGSAVTLLAGLPIIRASVGHGTAFDIAGQNKAEDRNLYEAIKLAAELGAKKGGGAR